MHLPCNSSRAVHLTEAWPESLTGAKLIAGSNWPKTRDFSGTDLTLVSSSEEFWVYIFTWTRHTDIYHRSQLILPEWKILAIINAQCHLHWICFKLLIHLSKWNNIQFGLLAYVSPKLHAPQLSWQYLACFVQLAGILGQEKSLPKCLTTA